MQNTDGSKKMKWESEEQIDEQVTKLQEQLGELENEREKLQIEQSLDAPLYYWGKMIKKSKKRGTPISYTAFTEKNDYNYHVYVIFSHQLKEREAIEECEDYKNLVKKPMYTQQGVDYARKYILDELDKIMKSHGLKNNLDNVNEAFRV